MSEGIDEPLFYTDALGNIMVKYKGLSFHPKAYHSLMSMPTAREQELEKENEELKIKCKDEYDRGYLDAQRDNYGKEQSE